jgi:hypothetical protein
MHHGQSLPEIAAGLLVLPERMTAAKIPSSKLDESINIAVWNIREARSGGSFSPIGTHRLPLRSPGCYPYGLADMDAPRAKAAKEYLAPANPANNVLTTYRFLVQSVPTK